MMITEYKLSQAACSVIARKNRALTCASIWPKPAVQHSNFRFHFRNSSPRAARHPSEVAGLAKPVAGAVSGDA